MHKTCWILMILIPIGTILTGAAAWAADCGNTVRGTQEPDLIDGSYEPPTTNCRDFIFALGGDDEVHALDGDDRVHGDNGNDTLFGEGGKDNVVGGGGNDKIFGGDGDDTLSGGSDDDQIFGDAGNDQLFGTGQNDYLDGGAGQNESDGGTDDDVVVGRSQRDTLTGGSGDDFLIIVGNSIAGYQLEGDTGAGIGDDLLFFAREATPEMVSDITIAQQTYRQLSFDLRTQLPVTVNLAQVPRVEAVATGEGDDYLVGTDLVRSPTTYFDRFQDSGTPLSVHELFFAAGGNDVIETLEGDDYVDAGAGDDTVKLGSGAHYLVTGPGRDTLEWSVPRLKSPARSTVADFTTGDRIHLLGDITPDEVTVAEAQDEARGPATLLFVHDQEKILLLGVAPGDVQIQEFRAGVEIRVLASISAPPVKSPRLLGSGKRVPR
jgi:Ca2+-binding RTX toxin-like protein